MWDPWWEEVIVFLAGLLDQDQCDALLLLLLRSGAPTVDVPRRMLFLAARCAVEARSGTGQVVDEIVEEVKALACAASAESSVESLVGMCARLDSAVHAVIGILEGPDAPHDLKVRIIRSLVEHGQDHASIVRGLVKSVGDPALGEEAVLALGALRVDDEEAVGVLVDLVSDTTRSHQRFYQSEWALGEIGVASPQVILTLVHGLSANEDEVSFRRHIEPLIKLNCMSLEVLLGLICHAIVPGYCRDDYHVWFQKPLGDWLRSYPAALSSLRKLIEVHRSPQSWGIPLETPEKWVLETARELGEIGDGCSIAMHAVLTSLSDDSLLDKLALGAAMLLGVAGDSSDLVVEELVGGVQRELANDWDSDLLYAIVGILGELGNTDEEVVNALGDILSSPEASYEDAVLSAVRALLKLGQLPPHAVDNLFALVVRNDPCHEEWVIEEAFGALAKHDQDRAREVVRILTMDGQKTPEERLDHLELLWPAVRGEDRWQVGTEFYRCPLSILKEPSVSMGVRERAADVLAGMNVRDLEVARLFLRILGRSTFTAQTRAGIAWRLVFSGYASQIPDDVLPALIRDAEVREDRKLMLLDSLHRHDALDEENLRASLSYLESTTFTSREYERWAEALDRSGILADHPEMRTALNRALDRSKAPPFGDSDGDECLGWLRLFTESQSSRSDSMEAYDMGRRLESVAAQAGESPAALSTLVEAYRNQEFDVSVRGKSLDFLVKLGQQLRKPLPPPQPPMRG